jgi:hypothetical protein
MEATTASLVETAPLLATVRGIGAGLGPDAMTLVADQALRMVRDYYVHLPQKVSAQAVNPVRELELLIDDVPYFGSDREFFHRLIGIVNRVRDRHTVIKLPAPLDEAVAFLPFALESCWEDGRRPLIVSKLTADVGDPAFTVGVEVTHWNGIPVGRYIERLGWDTNGANAFARIALALRSLTARPLAYMLPPDEDWVVLSYRAADGRMRSLGVPWRVYFPPAGGDKTVGQGLARVAGAAPHSPAAAMLGLDAATSLVNASWRDLYAAGPRPVSAEVLFERDPLAGAPNPLPDNIAFRLVRHGARNFGLVRIFSFASPDPAAFVRGFAQVLSWMPPAGLIVDVRANPGGTIPAGEALLQLFTERPIQASRLAFRATDAIQRLAAASPYFMPWRRSLQMKFETGDTFSQGYSLYADELAEGLRGVYRGKVAVIVDALSYSTTDFFAAGIQDNGIGVVIGTDPNTGAGGANVWSHAQIVDALGSADRSLQPLPAAIDVNVALRRSTRVGYNDGLPLEGLGVFAEHGHTPTRRDVLGHNEDLLRRAAEVLG